MLNIDEILFPNTLLTESAKNLNAIFNTNINWDTDTMSVDVSYFSLKNDKTLGEDIVINTTEQLIGLDVCEETGMINVCLFDENHYRYFWVKLDEIYNLKTVTEYWKIDDVKRHLKAINEKWTTKKNIKNELKQKKNKEKTIEQKEIKKRKLKF